MGIFCVLDKKTGKLNWHFIGKISSENNHADVINKPKVEMHTLSFSQKAVYSTYTSVLSLLFITNRIKTCDYIDIFFAISRLL
ncbi:hypothetical protein CJF42_00730 [Pseudoalteromonas sp. NBT06-2]|nr:hypothetical protein CJF42_00730 [Pseudoalteromonas sp. NBT06-2]